MNHDELRDLVPIYALDALGGDEELEVRSHVEACEPCRLLLESHLDAAAGLALAAESVTPPADLRSRLMAAVAASPLTTAVPLTGTGSGVNASAELYVSGDKHTAGLVARGLSDPGKNVYQLWLIENNVPAPVEAFRPDSSGIALVQIRTNLSNMQGMAVTVEARAGNPAPQGPFVLKS